MRVRLTRSAVADLDDIWEHTRLTWGEDQAEAYVSQIFGGFERAVAAPMSGRDRSVFVPGARSLKIGRHLVFYRSVGPDIVILRVVHERRNWAALGFADDQD
ncbi:type II toxin-antitoxin system RelE/ParE family toxin [Roseovarius ramblicola]|uniref:Toxin n=1 Tax=Roseovarius ramblicola TaxID=2022336 RepID=A0ABV5I1V6_9RHOB